MWVIFFILMSLYKLQAIKVPLNTLQAVTPSTYATGNQSPSKHYKQSVHLNTLQAVSPSTYSTGSQSPSKNSTGSQSQYTLYRQSVPLHTIHAVKVYLNTTGNQGHSTDIQSHSTHSTGNQGPSTRSTGNQDPFIYYRQSVPLHYNQGPSTQLQAIMVTTHSRDIQGHSKHCR